MDRLPSDWLNAIFGWLSPSDRAMARMVCGRWRRSNAAYCTMSLAVIATPDLCVWAQEQHGFPFRGGGLSWIRYDAAKYGHLALLQWAAREAGWDRDYWDEMTCSLAGQYGRLAVLQWARAQGAPWDEMTWVLAAQNGHVEILRWARENNGCEWDEAMIRSLAEERGHRSILEWLSAESDAGQAMEQ